MRDAELSRCPCEKILDEKVEGAPCRKNHFREEDEKRRGDACEEERNPEALTYWRRSKLAQNDGAARWRLDVPRGDVNRQRESAT